jgi:hypothetical protein
MKIVPYLLCALTLVLNATIVCADWKLDQMVTRDAEGRPLYHARPIDDRLKNRISADDEAAFQQRARDIIAAQAKMKVAAGNTYFENEKRTYGLLMAQVLAGNAEAIKGLQLEDAQAKEWHRETEGIDFFACFTLKHQTRKYFYFGELLEPSYRQRMFEGAKKFTSEDPLRRPHYAFKAPGGGWGPDQKNSWVDVRTTENLYLMRVTSVYLFAEETGNREVAKKYKEEIKQYARTLYRVGMGEWDSENYHGHSIGPLCNLYDFARDDEVRLLAKACLDWVFAAGAVKYYRGGFNGPTKRDYNHVQPFGGSAANMLMLHFGDCPQKEGDWESDEVHLITSAYRPPPAVLELARKQFKRPVEILSAKPSYSATTTGDDRSPPEYLETQYIGHSFLMGSLPSGTSEDGGDVNGFKILTYSQRRGANAIQGIPGDDPTHVGSPKYEKGKVAGPNRVGQYGNVAIWLVHGLKAPWTWVVPSEIKVSQEGDVTFLAGDKTWIAFRPLGTSPLRRDDAKTELITGGEKPSFPDHQVLSSAGVGKGYCGFIVEVGEVETHRSLAEFQRSVLKGEADASKLGEGIVQYRTADDQRLGFHWHDAPHELGVWRNGQRHDWKRHAGLLYGSAEQQFSRKSPIDSDRGSGKLSVATEHAVFTCTVDGQGQVSFANESR